MTEKKPFWERKSLAEMTDEEWESLCDGCALCCLRKIEDEDTGEIFYTYVSCRLLDTGTCRCTSYETRFEEMEDCLKIKRSNFIRMNVLPESCAYRRLSGGESLPSWHPLVTGNPESVHNAGISVRGRVFPEDNVHSDDLDRFIFFKVED